MSETFYIKDKVYEENVQVIVSDVQRTVEVNVPDNDISNGYILELDDPMTIAMARSVLYHTIGLNNPD
tara:strand:+ start:72 stop:275 length:204 start_codon:yes stop_codon:yes gene_type:complete